MLIRYGKGDKRAAVIPKSNDSVDMKERSDSFGANEQRGNMGMGGGTMGMGSGNMTGPSAGGNNKDLERERDQRDQRERD